MTAASTVTIRRFGPSGSLKNVNMILEHTMAVIPKIRSEIFFDLKYICLIVQVMVYLIPNILLKNSYFLLVYSLKSITP